MHLEHIFGRKTPSEPPAPPERKLPAEIWQLGAQPLIQTDAELHAALLVLRWGEGQLAQIQADYAAALAEFQRLQSRRHQLELGTELIELDQWLPPLRTAIEGYLQQERERLLPEGRGVIAGQRIAIKPNPPSLETGGAGAWLHKQLQQALQKCQELLDSLGLAKYFRAKLEIDKKSLLDQHRAGQKLPRGCSLIQRERIEITPADPN